MRGHRLLVVLAVVVAGAGAAPAFASGTGPSGSSEDDTNTVTCNAYANEPTRLDVEQQPSGVAVHGNTGTTYAGTNGVEACGDNGGSWRGRAYVTSSGAVVYDGATWGADPVAEDNGCTIVTSSGPSAC